MPSPPSFDRIARPYRWLEYLSLGPVLQQVRTHHLPALASTGHALVLGDGDGRFTARLLALNPFVHVEAVDLSRTMLLLLARRCAPYADRLRTTHANALTHTPAVLPDLPPDLIVTHFFLDCLTQPEADHLIARLAAFLPPGGLWLVSEFRIPPGPLAPFARLYLRLLYAAFRVLTGLRTTAVPDFDSPLRRAGLHPVATHTRLAGLLTTELWQKSFTPNPPVSK